MPCESQIHGCSGNKIFRDTISLCTGVGKNGKSNGKTAVQVRSQSSCLEGNKLAVARSPMTNMECGVELLKYSLQVQNE
jgi:hypothetical protein